MSEAIYAAAFVAEFNRLKAAGITQNFQIGYPYRGIDGHEAWERWCADLAHEHAEYVVKQQEAASNRKWAKKNIWRRFL